jgi:hypothetical protein
VETEKERKNRKARDTQTDSKAISQAYLGYSPGLKKCEHPGTGKAKMGSKDDWHLRDLGV